RDARTAGGAARRAGAGTTVAPGPERVRGGVHADPQVLLEAPPEVLLQVGPVVRPEYDRQPGHHDAQDQDRGEKLDDRKAGLAFRHRFTARGWSGARPSGFRARSRRPRP